MCVMSKTNDIIKQYTSESKTNDEELHIFQRYPDDRFDKKNEGTGHVKKQEQSSRDTLSDTKNNKSSEEKQSAVQLMLYDLTERYAFFNIANRHLYYYFEEEGYWRLLAENTVDVELRRLLTSKWIKSINSSSLNELYKWLLVETETKDISIFNTGREYLNFKDRAYNYLTEETTKNRQWLYFSYALAVKYPKNKKSSGVFDNFLIDIFGDDEKTKQEFSKFVAIAVSDIRDLKYVFHLFGPSNTGKSTVLNAIKHIIGPSVCSSLSFSQLSQEFYLSTLHGCRLNISGEISGVSKAKLDVLKSLSGNDSVAASYKFKDGFQFTSRCLLAFACNVLPNVDYYMDMQSYVSRMIIFPFRTVIERERWKLDFDQQLRDDEVGIVEFAISGLKKLVEDNYVINETKAMRQCKRDYYGQHDSFSLFSEKYIVEDPKEFLSSADIKKAYKQFCEVYDCEPLEDNEWPVALKRQFYCTPKVKNIRSEDGKFSKSARGYKGITFRKNIGKLLEEETGETAVSLSSIFEKKETSI